eukprot:13546150-Alexandrium_andersonii.AAC.1
MMHLPIPPVQNNRNTLQTGVAQRWLIAPAPPLCPAPSLPCPRTDNLPCTSTWKVWTSGSYKW